MKYIVAPISAASGNVICDLQTRRHSLGGLCMLNEIDLKCLSGTLQEKVASIGGSILNENEAMELINTKEWEVKS